jgi:hypothetical protein
MHQLAIVALMLLIMVAVVMIPSEMAEKDGNTIAQMEIAMVFKRFSSVFGSNFADK